MVQKAYDMGWNHGHEAGMKEKHNQIIGLLVDNIESIDWLKEEPILVRDIIPMVKGYKEEDLIPNTWDTWGNK